jgi:hypothetical protein
MAVISMMQHENLGNEELLARLRVLFAQLDPMDPVLLEHARLAFGWRTLEAEFAELSYDSVADREAMTTVRDSGPSGRRLLGFDAQVAGDADSALTIEVEVSGDRGEVCLVGQLMPPAPATVSMLSSVRRRPAATVSADELGRFRIEPVPSGPVRLRVQVAGRTVDTSWVSYASLPRAS